MYLAHTTIPAPGDSLPIARMGGPSGSIPVLDLTPDDPSAVTVQLSPADYDYAIRWLDALCEAAYDLAVQVRQRQRGLDRLLTAVDGVDQASVRLECHHCGRRTPSSVTCCEGDAADKGNAEAFGRSMRGGA